METKEFKKITKYDEYTVNDFVIGFVEAEKEFKSITEKMDNKIAEVDSKIEELNSKNTRGMTPEEKEAHKAEKEKLRKEKAEYNKEETKAKNYFSKWEKEKLRIKERLNKDIVSIENKIEEKKSEIKKYEEEIKANEEKLDNMDKKLPEYDELVIANRALERKISSAKGTITKYESKITLIKEIEGNLDKNNPLDLKKLIKNEPNRENKKYKTKGERYREYIERKAKEKGYYANARTEEEDKNFKAMDDLARELKRQNDESLRKKTVEKQTEPETKHEEKLNENNKKEETKSSQKNASKSATSKTTTESSEAELSKSSKQKQETKIEGKDNKSEETKKKVITTEKVEKKITTEEQVKEETLVTKSYSELTIEELENKQRELWAKAVDGDYIFRAHQENGMENYEDDEIDKQLREVRKELEARKAKIKEDEAKTEKEELKWHEKLTQEQIDYAISEKEIYTPEGPEYEQFLMELGINKPKDKVPFWSKVKNFFRQIAKNINQRIERRGQKLLSAGEETKEEKSQDTSFVPKYSPEAMYILGSLSFDDMMNRLKEVDKSGLTKEENKAIEDKMSELAKKRGEEKNDTKKETKEKDTLTK